MTMKTEEPLSATVEEYLETIYNMNMEGKVVIGARLAEKFRVAPPSVRSAVLPYPTCFSGITGGTPGKPRLLLQSESRRQETSKLAEPVKRMAWPKCKARDSNFKWLLFLHSKLFRCRTSAYVRLAN